MTRYASTSPKPAARKKEPTVTIEEGAVTAHASTGRHTLQVPEFSMGSPKPKETEVPARYFCYLLRDVPNPRGYRHLSRAGFRHFRAVLRTAYEAAGGTWADFEKETKEHFANVAEAVERKKKLLRKNLDALEAFKL